MAKQFIFGFGSLISNESRAKSGDSGASYPCLVHGVERSWSLTVDLPKKAQTNNAITAVSAVAVRQLEGNWDTTTNGVIVEVKEEELPNFDAREIGYKRVLLTPLTRVELTSGEDVSMCLGKDAKIWCYVAPDDGKALSVPNSSYPVIQTYLDVILDGCRSVGGEPFAKQFIATTTGWGSESGSFLNDRENPGYIRYSEVASAGADMWDKMLAETKPEVLAMRTPGPEPVKRVDWLLHAAAVGAIAVAIGAVVVIRTRTRTT